ncbi:MULTISPECIES: acetyl-CoA carboxylase biotin carboxylase subunit family protein [Actinomycetes]|uniref:ATP-grasp domain-containing protein n=1 Tax=Actinomycetes TaxID=1760 RepID=UPI0001B54B71|nr:MULTISPECIES: ATP-grasp domain-containing protein [Actinomycetes]
MTETIPQPVRDVLIVNRRRLELVERVLDDRRLRAAVITEPDCAELYCGIDDVIHVSNVQNLDEVRVAALELWDRRKFDAVLAPGETSIPAAGYLRSYFGLPGISFEVAHAFCDKSAMKARLRRGGIPVAGSTLVYRASALPATIAAHGFPAVVKPSWCDGAADVHVIANEFDAAAIALPDGPLSVASEPPFLVEDYVPFDEEYHCDGLVQDGRVVFTAVAKYLTPPLRSIGKVFGSCTLPHEDPDAAALRRLHADVVKVMGLRDSVTHLEVFRSPDGFVVGEIACRPGGGGVPHMLRTAYGFDTWDHYTAASLNEKRNWYPRATGKVHAWVMFPVEPGVVKRVPDVAAFEEWPEIDDFQLKIAAGDKFASKRYSTTGSAIAYCTVPSAADLTALVARLQDEFVIEYE